MSTKDARVYLQDCIDRHRRIEEERAAVELILRNYPDARESVLRRPEFQVPPIPTVELLTEERDRLREYADTPVRPRGDCYYSCCGLEDAEGERKDMAREHARLLTICIRVLKWS